MVTITGVFLLIMAFSFRFPLCVRLNKTSLTFFLRLCFALPKGMDDLDHTAGHTVNGLRHPGTQIIAEGACTEALPEKAFHLLHQNAPTSLLLSI
jgi:hypothetical protein